jgi:ligand-binding sensor domain-containing protein
MWRRNLLIDQSGVVYLGHSDGVYIINPSTPSLSSYMSLAGRIVINLFLSENENYLYNIAASTTTCDITLSNIATTLVTYH